jgi:hypothetical protein
MLIERDFREACFDDYEWEDLLVADCTGRGVVQNSGMYVDAVA